MHEGPNVASASPVLVVQMRESLFGDFATRSRIPFNLVSALGLGNLKTSPSVAGFVVFFFPSHYFGKFNSYFSWEEFVTGKT